MKKFIYVKQRGFISYQPSTATQTFQVKGTGFDGGVHFDHTIANTADAQLRFRVVITSFAGNTGNRGNDYTNANTTAGEVTVLEKEALTIDGNNLVILNVSGSNNEGYTIKDNDLIEITDVFEQDEGELLISLDSFLGVQKASATASVARFKSAERSASDDTILFVYPGADGVASHRKICSFFDAAINGSLANDDGFIEIDHSVGGIMPKEILDAGVTKITTTLQA